MMCEHRFQPYPDSLKIFCPKCGLALDPFAQRPTPPPVTPRRPNRRRRGDGTAAVPPGKTTIDPVSEAEAAYAVALGIARKVAEGETEDLTDLDDLADVIQGRPPAGAQDGSPSRIAAAVTRVFDDGSSLGRGTGL